MNGQPWVKLTHDNPRARLFVFPYAGGGSVDFRTWPEHLPSDVEVLPVIYPARERRLSERPIRHMGLLSEQITDAISPLTDRPFAFFGHSMGAWVAYEVARELARRDGPTPHHLVASARWAPHLPTPLTPIYHLPEPEFLSELQARYNAIPEQILARPAFLKMFLPGLRADFAVIDTYKHRAGPPLDCPITVVRGDADTTVDDAGLEGWKAHTEHDFRRHTLPGGHFFLRDDPAALARIVARCLP